MKLSLKLESAELSILLSTLAIGAALCAPQSASASSTPSATSSQPLSSALNIKTTNALPTPNKQSSSTANLIHQQVGAASALTGSPSLVNLKSAASSNNNNDELDTFDGKNPFSDDSLWQIPIHLVRDLSANEAPTQGNMAKSASEKMAHQESSYNDEGDDDESSIAPSSLPPQSASSSSPTIISASTDLKTAAGYHYPSHGGHHGYEHHGHDYGHHGGHGDHGDHYGKYFQ